MPSKSATSSSTVGPAHMPASDGQSASPVPNDDGQVTYGTGSLHAVFQSQIAEILARSDLDEEQKQAILIGVSCPCCGGGASVSISLKLKSDP